MFWSVLAAEQSKIFKRKILWVEAAILMAAAVFILAVSYAVTSTPDQVKDITWPGAPPVLVKSFANLEGIFVVVLVASVVAQEYTWRSLHLLLSRGIPRLVVLAAKFGAVVLPLLLLVAAPLLVGISMTGLFTLWKGASIDLNQMNYAGIGLGTLAAVYVLLPYAAGSFALAILSRSTVTAIGAGVAFALVENVGLQLLQELGGAGSRVATVFPAMLVGGVLGGLLPEEAAPAVSSGQAQQFLDPLPAALLIALYTAVFLAAAARSFTRQDLTG